MYKTIKLNLIWTLIAFCFVVFTTANYYANVSGFVDQAHFDSYQRDAESLVVGNILHDKVNPDNDSKFHLGYAHNSGSRLESFAILENNQKHKYYVDHLSLYGLQGAFYSYLYNDWRIDSLNALKLLCALLTVLSLLLLSVALAKIYGLGFAMIFALSVSFSPWMIQLSGNLFWSPFSWFLPVIFAALSYLHLGSKKHVLYLVLFFLSVLMKALMGYEYLSTVLIFASVFYLLAPFSSSPKLNLIQAIQKTSVLAVLSVVAFVIALLAHADLRGDTIMEGLSAIWEEDVLRRTYGDPSKFGPEYTESLEISPFAVVGSYLSNWKTDLVAGISGDWFMPLVIYSILMLAYAHVKRLPNRYFLSMMFALFMLAPISWYVLAKGHSQIHQHINFVLWYVGTLAALIYISAVISVDILRRYLALCLEDQKFWVMTPIFLIAVTLFGFSESNEDFDETMLRLNSDASLQQTLPEGFSVYWLNDELFFYKAACTMAQAKIIVDLYPADRSQKVNTRQGYERVALEWNEVELDSPNFMSSYSGGCVSSTKLSSFRLAQVKISLAQGEGVKWQEEIDLSSLQKATEVTTHPHNDARWRNGIMHRGATIGLNSTLEIRQTLKKGDVLVFPKSGERVIRNIVYSGNFMIVTVAGGALDPVKDGNPNLIRIKPTEG